ncbi:MAG: formyltransferase [Candidatus Obscuribacterales bacterium]|nr:formyltransferase [Steroidobacteraceae bacterium]
MTRAVVFAYHNVGVRCLSVLLAHNVEVPLVITHIDSASENIWFDSVEKLATINRLPCATPTDPNTPEWIERIRALQPDLIFSFYYRHMLTTELLATARLGAYNLHGSLLPKFRGRVPINWAVIKGERVTGATLHRMVAKPDAGPMVAQQSVPILPDDTAYEVFQKVTLAGELVLDRVLSSLSTGTAVETPLDLSAGSYFGGRKPEDGRIDWTLGAQTIHNLIRGVAPPYPGAVTVIQGKPLRILRSRLDRTLRADPSNVSFYVDGARLLADCIDARVLELLHVEYENRILDAAGFTQLFGATRVNIT